MLEIQESGFSADSTGLRSKAGPDEAHHNALDAARIVDEALAGATAGNAGWLLPIEPLLQVTAHPDIWARALARLRNRAA